MNLTAKVKRNLQKPLKKKNPRSRVALSSVADGLFAVAEDQIVNIDQCEILLQSISPPPYSVYDINIPCLPPLVKRRRASFTNRSKAAATAVTAV